MTHETAREAYVQAVALHRQGRLSEAEALYGRVHAVFPEHPGALHGLGLIAFRTGRASDAVHLLAAAAHAAPQNAPIHSDLGTACLAAGRYEDAVNAFDTVLRHRPGDPVACMGLGDGLSVLGRLDEASAVFESLLANDAGDAAAHFGLGNIAMQRGDTERARSYFERAVAARPGLAKYHRALAETARFVPGDARLEGLEKLVRTELADGEQAVESHFALAKAYDDLGRYDDAFAQLAAGNEIQRHRVAYDEAAVARFFDDVASAFPPAVMRAHENSGYESELPVFIVGMPRAGSTLVEQMLASHPEVFGAGELLFLNDIVAAVPHYPAGVAGLPKPTLASLGKRHVDRIHPLAPDAKRIVDKLPGNFRHLGLIHLMLPRAKIIHVQRSAMDTCFSCYSKLFLSGLNFTYDLGELGRYHKMHDALMAHWRSVLPSTALLDVQYEALIGDFERQARRIVEFTGLTWDPRCLDFSKTERPVRTLSQSQVRQPLFTSSIGRWRPYENHLQPLIDALA